MLDHDNAYYYIQRRIFWYIWINVIKITSNGNITNKKTIIFSTVKAAENFAEIHLKPEVKFKKHTVIKELNYE